MKALRRGLCRAILRWIPNREHREMILEDLEEDLAGARARGARAPRLRYWAGAFESVADWWLGRRSAGDVWSGLRPTGWAGEIRSGFRLLRREPVVSAAVLVTIVVAVASATAVVSLLEGVLWRPLPFPDSEAIVQVSRASEGRPADFPHVGLPDLRDWRDRSTSLDALAGWTVGSAVWIDGRTPERLAAANVTPGMGRVLGIQPAHGRLFVSDDFVPTARATGVALGRPVVVLAHAFWRDAFGGDPAVVGRDLELADGRFEIVGVLPPSDVDVLGRVDLWLPLAPAPDSWMLQVRGASWIEAVGRLRPGVSREAAEQELTAIQTGLLETAPRENEGQDGVALRPLRDVVADPARTALLLIAATAGLLLALAAVNVGVLLLSRAARRRGELAIRAALGGGRVRLVRLLTTEAGVLAGLGGLGGLLLSRPLVAGLLRLYPGEMPRAAEVGVRPEVFAGVFATVVAATVLGAVLPGRGTGDDGLADELRGRGGTGGVGQRRVRSALAAFQLAVSAVLLVGAGLFTRTLLELESEDPGFRGLDAMTFTVLPPSEAYPDAADIERFYRRLLARIEAVPGVERAGGVNFLPFAGGDWGGGFEAEGTSHDSRVRLSWPGYFEALGLGLREGRAFEWSDGPDAAPVALLNEAAARAAFDGESPIGRVIRFEGAPRQVVGVVRDIRHASLADAPVPEVHVPAAQLFNRRSATLVVRASADAAALVPALRAAVADTDPRVALSGVATMRERIASSVDPERFRARLVLVLAGIAFGIAVVGVYGVTVYSVSQRRREIGIRLALGESRASVFRRILSSALAIGAAGTAAGLAIATVTGGTVRNLLYGIAPWDPRTFLLVPVTLLAATAICAVPAAISAARVRPGIALGRE